MRINVTMADEDGRRHVIGHFDHDKAVQFNAAPGRNGQPRNLKDRQRLYHTKEGRWVLYDCLEVTSGGEIGPHSYIKPGQAREWLERNEHEEALREIFLEASEGRNPGRPTIGARANLSVGPDRLAAIDAWARARKLTRGEAVRQLLDIALEHELMAPAPRTAGR